MYTRRGDKGETSLYGSKRVPKDSARVEAYGTIDELSSVLGVAASTTEDTRARAALKDIQRMLFVAGADSACELKGSPRIPRIGRDDTARLERMTDDLLKTLPPIRNFILPGGAPTAAALHHARAVCRRAERRILSASRTEEMNPELLPFFNRLSTYLFNLAREANRKKRVREEYWKY